MKRFLFWGRDSARAGVVDGREASSVLTGDPRQDQHSLEVLLESIADVSSSMDLDRVLVDIVDKSLQVTRAERGVLLLGTDADALEVRVARDRKGRELDRNLNFSRSIVRRAFVESQAVRSVVQSDRQALELGQSVFDLKLRAVMCAPMQARERQVGVIYVDSTAARREFSSRDLALFGALSAQLAIAVENARLHADSIEKARLQKNVEIARDIQQHLLAPVPHQLPALDVALRYLPCEAASGDTYDFIPLADERVVVVTGDVTGHGVGAALLTHAAQAAMRSYFELIDDLGEVITRLNSRLAQTIETGNFMSLLAVCIDPVAGSLHYVNAGHPDLLHVTGDGIAAYGKTGMVLGVVEGADYEVCGPVPIAPGDLLFMHTDGVEEAMNQEREMFGEERLRSLLEAQRGNPPGAVLDRVQEALEQHRGGAALEDDVTMVALSVRGPEARVSS